MSLGDYMGENLKKNKKRQGNDSNCTSNANGDRAGLDFKV